MRIHPWVDVVYSDDPSKIGELGGELHIIDLVKTPEGWKLIRDSYRDEFTILYPYGTDFNQLQVELPEQLAAAAARDSELAKEPGLTERQSGQAGPQESVGILGVSYRDYDRSRCASYATTYTNNNVDCSTTNYNTLFVNYTYKCADCQNFVSQCVWYGFGGQNTSQAIQGHYLPMVYNVTGATNWWADKYTTGSNWTWTSVPNFESMINANWSNDKVGVQGHEGHLGLTWKGDVVSMRAYQHVFIINNIIDYDGDGRTDYNEIYVCAHTKNRKNARLSSVVPNPSDVKYLWIEIFKNP